MEKLVLVISLLILTSCTKQIPGSPFHDLKCEIAVAMGQELSFKIKEELSCKNTLEIQKDLKNVLVDLKLCDVKETVQTEKLFCKPVTSALLKYLVIKAVPHKWECDISSGPGFEKLKTVLTKLCQ